MSVTIKLRRASSSEWNSTNPILKLAEPGYETDTKKLKIGDGLTHWNNLNYLMGDNNQSVTINVEDIDDEIAKLIVAGYGIYINYDDPNNILTISTTGLQPSGNCCNPFDQNLNTTDSPSFYRASIGDVLNIGGGSSIGSGTGSGDGNNKGTIELVPDNTLYNNDQYLIVDPTAPNHIHLRAGGTIDSSDAELIIGGEHAHVRVVDNNHQVTVKTASGGLQQFTVWGGDTGGLGFYISRTDGGYIPEGSTFEANGITYTVGVAYLDEGTPFMPVTPPGFVADEPFTGLFNVPLEDKNWTFGNDGNLNIPGNISLPNGTSVAIGSYDNNTGGNNGVSLNCAVGYELNWQGGHLRSSEIGNPSVTQPILIDSPLQFPGSGVANVQVSNSGIVFSDGTTQTTAAIGGGGLSDSNTYIICKTGDNLIAKYAAAKLLTPGGNALSATNRATLIIMPGDYSLSEELTIDAEFVDILGLGSMKLDRGCVVAVRVTGYDINASANNVRIKGIGTPSDRAFKIDGDKPLQVFEECIGGSDTVAGTFSFGGNTGFASGTFTNCNGGNYSFGGGAGIASGTFTNCNGGDYSFGTAGGTASGTFTNCNGGDYSFGGNNGTASGIFTNCIGGNSSFGGDGGIASGKFISCRLTTGTFPTLSGSGKIRLCIDGNYDVINTDAP